MGPAKSPVISFHPKYVTCIVSIIVDFSHPEKGLLWSLSDQVTCGASNMCMVLLYRLKSTLKLVR